MLRAGCKISSLAGGRERGRPAGRGAVGRDQCFSGEHPVGLFADRTRRELTLQRTLRARRTIDPGPPFHGGHVRPPEKPAWTFGTCRATLSGWPRLVWPERPDLQLQRLRFLSRRGATPSRAAAERPHLQIVKRAAIVLALLLAGTAAAADPPRIPDVVLTDETGRQIRVYDELVKDRVVAVNFIFTTCPTICQPMSATFSQLESMLGSRPVRLVSVSVDPGTDTPQRLAAWKARFHGGRSWTLLTGSLPEIDRLRKALGVYTPDRFSHTPTVVVLDDRRGRSTRISGLAPARAIVETIDALFSGSQKSMR